MNKIWKLSPSNEKAAYLLSKKYKIPYTLANILVNRDIAEDKIDEFLHPEKIAYLDPFLLKEMDLAVNRLMLARENNEKICIYGDYDVDGVTSTTLLVKVLRELGFNVDYYLPNRHSEGYGLHIESLDLLKDNYSLIITVDCGITAVEEAEFCIGKLDLIITDHHLPLEILPKAVARINPNQVDCNYPNKNLCGVGVAFKLCQALYQKLNLDLKHLDKYLDIVALGTIADLVPLVWENRRFVKTGLENIHNLGIKSLLELSKADVENVNTGHIGFGVAPRLNAAGRLAHASAAVEVLIEDDFVKINEKSLFLDEENRHRQQLVEEIVNSAISKVEENPTDDKILVIVGENWNEGVIGIAASRLQEKYYKPIIIIALNDGVGKASCRSIESFNIKQALDDSSDFLEVYGGHSMAAGFTILENNISDFSNKITNYANNMLTTNDLIPKIKIDAKISPEELNVELVEMLDFLEPYGMGNNKPQFVARNFEIKESRTIGKNNNHLKLKLQNGFYLVDAVFWNKADILPEIVGKNVDIVFQPEINEWRNNKNLQLKLTDIRISNPNLVDCPSYGEIGKVYLALNNIQKNLEVEKVENNYLKTILKEFYNVSLSNEELNIALKILEELEIIKILDHSNIKILPQKDMKIDISMSKTYLEYKTSENEI